MVVFPEATARLFHRVYVCKACKSKIKAPSLKVIAGKVGCRKCGKHALRTVRRK